LLWLGLVLRFFSSFDFNAPFVVSMGNLSVLTFGFFLRLESSLFRMLKVVLLEFTTLSICAFRVRCQRILREEVIESIVA